MRAQNYIFKMGILLHNFNLWVDFDEGSLMFHLLSEYSIMCGYIFLRKNIHNFMENKKQLHLSIKKLYLLMLLVYP